MFFLKKLIFCLTDISILFLRVKVRYFSLVKMTLGFKWGKISLKAAWMSQKWWAWCVYFTLYWVSGEEYHNGLVFLRTFYETPLQSCRSFTPPVVTASATYVNDLLSSVLAGKGEEGARWSSANKMWRECKDKQISVCHCNLLQMPIKMCVAPVIFITMDLEVSWCRGTEHGCLAKGFGGG